MTDSRLLHRESEIAALQTVVQRLQASRPSVLLIDGARGIGKSALLAELQRLLPSDVVLLRARCAEIERGFSLGMVGQLFDAISIDAISIDGTSIDGTSIDAFPPPAGALDAGVMDAPAMMVADGGPDGPGIRKLLDGLYQSTRTLAAGRPVVLLIDDIQLADEQSRQWFSYIARRLDDLPVAAIATADLDAAAAEAAGHLGADRRTTTRTHGRSDGRVIDIGAEGVILQLGPLCASCTDELAATLLGAPLDDDLVALCHAVSGGNPEILRDFAGRLQRAGISPGTPDLARAVAIGAAVMADTTLSWLHDRDSSAVDLLAALVVLGPAAGLPAAALLAGQGGYQAEESVSTLSRAGLITPGALGDADAPVVFSDLVRAAVLHWVGGARRLDLHRRAGELLTRVGSSAAQAAEHLMLVGPSDEPWVLATLRSAAREMAEAGRPDTAVGYLRRAAGGTGADPGANADRLALDSEIGSLEMYLDLPAAIRCAASIAQRAPGFAERSAALLPLVSPALVTESGPAVRPFLQLAATAVTLPVIAQEQLRFGALSLLAGHPVGLRAWTRAVAERGTGSALPDGAPARALLSALSAVTAASGRFRPRASRLAARASSGGDAGAAVVGAILAATWAERFDDAENLATAQVSRAEQRGHRTELALALISRADVRHRRGRPAAARADATRAAQFARSAGARGLGAAAAALVAVAASTQGHPDVAAEALDRIDLPVDANPLIRAMVLRARGVAALAVPSAGDAAARQALAFFLECGHELASRGIANPACLPWRSDLSAAHLRLGESEAAAVIATEDVALARRWGAPGALGRALAMLGAARPPDQGRELLVQAVGLLEPTGMALDLANAHRLLAVAHEACDDGLSAAEHRHRAAELAGRCGVTLPGAAGPGGAAGTGTDRRPGGVPPHPPRLTMSEARVSDLVLRGLSNQQVADQLCISRRTVDTHLNRIYRKLEIRSRGELGYALKLLG